MALFSVELQYCQYWEVAIGHWRRWRGQRQATAWSITWCHSRESLIIKMVKKALFVFLTSSFTNCGKDRGRPVREPWTIMFVCWKVDFNNFRKYSFGRKIYKFHSEEQDCTSSDDCDNGGMCNYDYGSNGGFCETCPGDTEQACIATGFHTELGTEECKKLCVVEQSEYFYELGVSSQIASLMLATREYWY